MQGQRPLSPHLQIYRWPITMALSISHRATGIALALGTLMLVWWLMALVSGPADFEMAQEFAGSWLGVLLLLGWSFALLFHLATGVRHLFWDIGAGYEIPTSIASSWAVIAATAVLTLIAWIAGIASMAG